MQFVWIERIYGNTILILVFFWVSFCVCVCVCAHSTCRLYAEYLYIYCRCIKLISQQNHYYARAVLLEPSLTLTNSLFSACSVFSVAHWTVCRSTHSRMCARAYTHTHRNQSGQSAYVCIAQKKTAETSSVGLRDSMIRQCLPAK